MARLHQPFAYSCTIPGGWTLAPKQQGGILQKPDGLSPCLSQLPLLYIALFYQTCSRLQTLIAAFLWTILDLLSASVCIRSCFLYEPDCLFLCYFLARLGVRVTACHPALRVTSALPDGLGYVAIAHMANKGLVYVIASKCCVSTQVNGMVNIMPSAHFTSQHFPSY
jgi:hypothetical protein